MLGILSNRKKEFIMAKNKTSVWSIIILVATIISLVLLVTSIVLTVTGIPAAMDAAKQAAIEEGVTAEEANVVAGIAIGAVIAALVFSSIFDILKVIGGFMFSLKGRWGIFCIIVSIIALAMGVWSLISNIVNKVGPGTIVSDSISVAISALLVIACFKHRAEIR